MYRAWCMVLYYIQITTLDEFCLIPCCLFMDRVEVRI